MHILTLAPILVALSHSSQDQMFSPYTSSKHVYQDLLSPLSSMKPGQSPRYTGKHMQWREHLISYQQIYKMILKDTNQFLIGRRGLGFLDAEYCFQN